ncbi:hypothetical protein MKEN_01267400 [Mycena kentingensis (nom. inval.)]|nr:hypothetical protein MKEN_01267400 [Mycena kentingensis (nom. inval.)]
MDHLTPTNVSALLAVAYLVYRVTKRSPFANITGPPAESYLFGNIPQLISGDGYEFHEDLAQNYGGIVKLNAICGDAQLYIHDHAAMQSVLVKNEPIFNMPDIFLAANGLMFGPCLVSTSGARHRRGRKVMNPVFSPARLKEILPILYKIAHGTANTLSQRITDANAPDGRAELDMLRVLGVTALEFIGQAGLGYSFAAAQSDALEDMKQLLFAAKRMIIPMQILPFLVRSTPAFLRRLSIPLVPLPDLWLAKRLVDIMHANSVGILSGKRAAMAKGDAAVLEQVGHGKDIMSLLMRASDKTNPADRLPEEELLGQMNVIIFAGTDTTSTALSRALQELAMQPELQTRLRDEVTKAAVHGDLDYETLMRGLPLLDAVCRETLRMYPPAVTASREALQDTVLPLSTPMTGVDGSQITEVFVPKGTLVHVGIKAANTREAYWGPDARQWKPERWLVPLPSTIADADIPGIVPKLMSFIGGPRGCIGFKFAEMSMKVVLAVLLKEFKFEISETEIVWKLGVAEAPSVDGKHALPMVISRV